MKTYLEVEFLGHAVGRDVRPAGPHDVLDVELFGLVGSPRADLERQRGGNNDLLTDRERQRGGNNDLLTDRERQRGGKQ